MLQLCSLLRDRLVHYALFVYQLVILWMWLVAGGATFFLYAVDKTQAILGNWRIPEQVLHLFALVGGVFGGWLGMFVLWHKVRKPATSVPEEEIDRLVYQLYGLTEEEIAIVEGAGR